MGKGSAGYSARKRAQQLRREHYIKSSKWIGGATAVGAVGSSAALGSASVVSLVAGGAAGVAAAVWQSKKPSPARRWFQGAAAEKRTGRHLRRLPALGWEVMHDRSIPRSKANLDHVLIHPSGKFLVYVDTKAWHAAGARIFWDGRRLMYGPWSQTQKLETVEWEASRLAELTGLKVVPVIAVDRGNVVGPAGSPGLINIKGTYVVKSDALCDVLARMDQLNGTDRRQVARVRKTIDRVFPAAQ